MAIACESIKLDGVRPCATCARNGYPKSGMSLATKSLRSLRARSLRRPWSSSWSLTNLLRCIWGRVTLPLADVDPRWRAIAYGSIKLNGCRTLSDLLKKQKKKTKKWLSQEWDEPFHQVFGELKTKFSSPPVVKFAELDKPFEVHTGADVDARWRPLHMGA